MMVSISISAQQGQEVWDYSEGSKHLMHTHPYTKCHTHEISPGSANTSGLGTTSRL